MLDPSGISESWSLLCKKSLDPPPTRTHTHTHVIFFLKKKPPPELAFKSPVYGWDLKPWLRLHMTLKVGGLLNTKTAIVSGPGPPDFIRVCPSCAISGISIRGWMGGGHLSSLARQIITVRNSDVFSDFFLEMKAPIDKTAGVHAGLGICCLNVSKANFTWQGTYDL